MIARTLTLVAAAALALGSTACSEKPQTAGTQRKASDTAPWAGTRSTNADPALKPGDQAAWNDLVRSRAQGQNDYARGGS